jgi:competence protein ComEA
MSSGRPPHGLRLAGLALLLGLLAPVPFVGAQASADEAQESAVPAGQVNLNTASAEELQRLPGVGPSRALAIVAYREQRPFRRIEELMRIRGIGRATFRRLRPMLTLDGPTTLPPR